MQTDGHFKRLELQPTEKMPADLPIREAFFRELNETVVERFHRITGQTVVVAPIELAEPTAEGVPPRPAPHPLCVEHAGSETCKNSWRLHLAELALRPQLHWHRCPNKKFCAAVPVVWHRRCLAVCRLVGPESMAEEMFDQSLELLDVLVENFATRNADRLLSPLLGGEHGNEQPADAADHLLLPALKRPTHPQILKAITFIEQNLTNQDLSVMAIARLFGMNATYLAHIFAEQVGVRMSRYIATLRVGVAKKLLASTDWQVKRIALEVGYANPDWFSHVFHAHTGQTPGDFRRQLRENS